MLGGNFRSDNRLYGSYPHRLAERVMSLFPECKRIIHLFSGTIPASENVATYDIRKRFNPTIRDDVRNIVNHKDVFKKADIVIADPPYDDSDFEKYSEKPFNKRLVIHDLFKVMRAGAYLAWLDTKPQQYSSSEWKLIGYIAVITSTNRRVRLWQFLQRRGKTVVR
jgi:hypothetical protein